MTVAKPSKSAKKREYQALQQLGERLIDLTAGQLAAIDTDEYLIEQVLIAKKIRAHGALRRQKQLIGKIMREVDAEPIRLALAQFGSSDRAARAVFKQAELWRDRLARQGLEVMDEFVRLTGQPSEMLAEQVAKHQNAADSEHRRHIRRKIFREIHRILSAEMHNTGV